MVTHRGTSQKDATVHVAAEPADGPGSENHPFVVLFHGDDATVRLPRQRQRSAAVTAPHRGHRSTQSGLTIPSSAASEASPLQRVVRPIFAKAVQGAMYDNRAKPRDLGPREVWKGPSRLGGSPESLDRAPPRAE